METGVQVTAAGKPADVCADQILVVNKSRLSRKLGVLSVADARARREFLTAMYGEP